MAECCLLPIERFRNSNNRKLRGDQSLRSDQKTHMGQCEPLIKEKLSWKTSSEKLVHFGYQRILEKEKTTGIARREREYI